VEEVEDEEEQEEEATESYCSSDLSSPRLGTGNPERASETASAPVEQTVKMSRVLAWRNSFDSVFTESNAGMFYLSPLTLRWYPFLATPRVATSDDFGSVSHVFSRIRFPLTPARAITLALFFLTQPSI